MSAYGAGDRRLRLLGMAALAGAGLWLVAVPLILAEPAWLPTERAYGTVVAAAAVLLIAGATGVRYRFGWPRARPLAGFLAMWRRLDRVLDPGYDHRTEPGLRDVPGQSTSARFGIMMLRSGLLLVALGGLQLAAGGLAWRPTYWLGWFLSYAGAVGLGVAITTSAQVLPRRGGILLAVSGLAVLKPVVVVVGGVAREPESLGPVLPLALGEPWMVAVAALLWVLFGLAWLELGRALRSEGVAQR